MKIALLTMFNGLSTTYSLVNVVKEQLTMLLTLPHIQIKCLVSQDCPDQERHGIFLDPRIEWIKVTNRYNGHYIHWYDYTHPDMALHDTFWQEAQTISKDYIHYLEDVDFCLLHDIHYQGWHLIHNIALHLAQPQLPHLRFLAFTHSAPEPPPNQLIWPFSARFMPLPYTHYVYPTSSGLQALARQFNVPSTSCHVVSNTLDPLLGLSPETHRIHDQVNLLANDFLIIYPARLTPSKKLEKVAALSAKIHEVSGLKVQIIFCDFSCADITPSVYKDLILKHGELFGLPGGSISFTSDLGFPEGLPRESVLELLGLSNLFICPSYSESFGLTLLEAASRGNFLVVNDAVPALAELGTRLGAYKMRWDALGFSVRTTEHYHPSESAYYLEHAQRIITLMQENTVIAAKTLARTQYNPEYIFKTQLLPLLQDQSLWQSQSPYDKLEDNNQI
ncbi:MAG: glycosyltransferase [Cellulosilyticaceae bacterium]